jgi:hypothetical protein
LPVPAVRAEAEVGSGMSGSRAKVPRLLADPEVSVVVAGHRGRLGRMSTGLAGSALSAHGRWLVVLDNGEVAGGVARAAGLARAGRRRGRRAGFPRFAKKGRDRDRVTFTTSAIRVEPSRRHVTLPRIGTVRVHENTRRLEG